MKFGFVTCVQLGLACMEEIYKVGGKLDLVISLHDKLARKKSGRIYVDDFCSNHDIEVVKIRHIDDQESISAVRERRIDWLFIIGWSQIAGKEILEAPKRGCLGMHPTLLPKGRGRAAIPWAIIKGLDKTGVTLFKLDEGVDTGPILLQEVIAITPNETASSLYERVAAAHQTLIKRVWPDLEADTVTLQAQDDNQATEWPGRRPEDGAISPTMDCAFVDRLVRAVTRPYPGAFIDHESIRYRIWQGAPLPEEQIHYKVLIDPSEFLLISVSDGVYRASIWEKELIPQG